jgi:hypothetical protein
MDFDLIAFFGGIIASFSAWFFISFLFKPKLQIDESIYRFNSVDNEGSYVYKAKVINKSRLFNVYDVNLAARVYVYGLIPDEPGEYRIYIINAGVKTTPYIASKRKKNKLFTPNERYFVLKPPYSESKDKGKLRKLYNQYHESDPCNGIFTLEDVFHIVEEQKHKTKIEFSITATSAFSASRAFVTAEYLLENINKDNDVFDNESLGD